MAAEQAVVLEPRHPRAEPASCHLPESSAARATARRIEA
jgi:hypothetical protein